MAYFPRTMMNIIRRIIFGDHFISTKHYAIPPLFFNRIFALSQKIESRAARSGQSWVLNQSMEAVEIFEVFRMGPKEKSNLTSLPLKEIQSKYTLLAPVMSIDQIENAQALATLPLPGKSRIIFVESVFSSFRPYRCGQNPIFRNVRETNSKNCSRYYF